MKKILFVIALMFSLNAVNAQHGLNVHTNPLTCTDIEMVVYVWDLNGCTILGESMPLPVPAGTISYYDYTSISAIGWVTDPGPWANITNEWYFGAADVFNCNAAPTTGGTCANGNFVTVGETGCGYAGLTDCFEYTNNVCGTCGMNHIVYVALSPAPGVNSNISITD